MAEVGEWRKRHGGTLYAMWPYAASGLAGLRTRLPRMPAYQEHALAIAEAVKEIPGVEVVPDPPHTPMMHLLLPTGADELRASAFAMAQREGIWTFAHPLGTETQAAMLYSCTRPPNTSRRRTSAASKSPAFGHWLPMGD